MTVCKLTSFHSTISTKIVEICWYATCRYLSDKSGYLITVFPRRDPAGCIAIQSPASVVEYLPASEVIPKQVRLLPQKFVERFDEYKNCIVHERGLCGNALPAGAQRLGRIETTPSLQEVLDVTPGRVYYPKARYIYRPVFDHLALPSIVHYLENQTVLHFISFQASCEGFFYVPVRFLCREGFSLNCFTTNYYGFSFCIMHFTRITNKNAKRYKCWKSFFSFTQMIRG